MRRKKLAKKRDQVIQEMPQQESSKSASTGSSRNHSQDSTLELTLQPEELWARPETKVNQAPKLIAKRPSNNNHQKSLESLREELEQFFNVQAETEVVADPNQVTIVGECKSDSRLFSLFQCKSTSVESEDFFLLSSKTVFATCYDRALADSQKFHGDPCRYLPRKWSKLLDISTFCKQYLNNSQQLSKPETSIMSPEVRSSLVDSLVLQLHSILARFELGTSGSLSRGSRPRTVGDVNETLVGVAEDEEGRIFDTLLLLPTKEMEQENPDDGGSSDQDSLSMMQSFCLQVFLIRLTSMITNEDNGDGSGGLALRRTNSTRSGSGSSPHYRNLVRRNQNGFSSLRDLYLMCAVDIFRLLPPQTGSSRRSTTGTTTTTLSDQHVRDLVEVWFRQAKSPEQIAQYCGGDETPGLELVNILTYMQILFASNPANQGAAIALVQKELSERS